MEQSKNTARDFLSYFLCSNQKQSQDTTIVRITMITYSCGRKSKSAIASMLGQGLFEACLLVLFVPYLHKTKDEVCKAGASVSLDPVFELPQMNFRKAWPK